MDMWMCDVEHTYEYDILYVIHTVQRTPYSMWPWAHVATHSQKISFIGHPKTKLYRGHSTGKRPTHAACPTTHQGIVWWSSGNEGGFGIGVPCLLSAAARAALRLMRHL